MAHYFISDLHLKAERLDIILAFFDFLKEKAPKADAIYILGDFFEYWIGDDVQNSAITLIKKALRKASAHTNLYFIHGNRDFLLGQAFCQDVGMILLPEQHTIKIGHDTILLLHGDELCTRDLDYMTFREKVRDKDFQQEFLSHSIPERINIAMQAREESKKDQKTKSTEIMDVTPEEVIKAFSQHNCDFMLHGHTHRPAVHDLSVEGTPKQRIVLGDWDTLVWYVKWNDTGYNLKHYPVKSFKNTCKVWGIERIIMPLVALLNKRKKHKKTQET